MLQLATIGTSWITEEFIEGALMTGKYSLNTVYSRHLEKADQLVDKYNGGYAIDDLDQLWQDNSVDVVYIASPNLLHFDHTIAAINSGKHVIVEKPIFTNLTEWDKAHELAKEKGVYLLEAARHIHTKNYQHLKQLIKFKTEKVTYPFLGANLNIGQYSSKYDRYNQALKANEPVPNVFNPEFAGGVLMDLGVYPIYVAIDLFGKPISADYKVIKGQNNVDLFGHVIFEYDGFNVVIFISKAVHSQLHNEFYFDNETVRVNNITDIDRVEMFSTNNGEIATLAYEVENTLYDEATAFADIILNNKVEDYKYLTNLSRNVREVMDQLNQSV